MFKLSLGGIVALGNNISKGLASLFSLGVIVYKIYDVINLIEYQRKLISEGITDTTQINSQISDGFIAILIFAIFFFILIKSFKNSE